MTVTSTDRSPLNESEILIFFFCFLCDLQWTIERNIHNSHASDGSIVTSHSPFFAFFTHKYSCILICKRRRRHLCQIQLTAAANLVVIVRTKVELLLPGQRCVP